MAGPARGPARILRLLATHPIQYQAPWFRALAARPELDFAVWFGALPDADSQGVGFDTPFEWDVPLLDGYRWECLAPPERRSPELGRFAAIRVPGLGARLRRERPDAVLVTGWNSLYLVQGLLAARRAGVPRLLRGEANALRARPWWVRAIHRRLLAAADAFLVIGAANRAFYRGYGVAAERLFACPYFVDNDRFAAQAAALAPERASLRAAWTVASGATAFLFAGKLIAKKRPLDLVAAAAAARERGARLHLLFAGDGPLRGELEAAARAQSVPATFAGFLNQSQIARAYVAADALVLPSDAGETWGLVVNEAMACGRPAIVSDRVGCAADLVIEGATGSVVPLGDVAALAERLASWAAAPERRREMGAAARRRVLADYSVERAVDGTLAALAAVTGAPAGAAAR